MDKKVIGPLSALQFFTILISSAIISGSYHQFGLTKTFWLISTIVVAIAIGVLIFNKSQSQ